MEEPMPAESLGSQGVRRGVLRHGGRPSAWLAALALTACGGSGSGGDTGLPPGVELAKPGGGTFFVDPSLGGSATRLHLVEMSWGRLVDVHALDGGGKVDPEPAFRDLVI